MGGGVAAGGGEGEVWEDHVQGSAVGKYGREFSCIRASISLQRLTNSGHSLEWLGCEETGPQLTQQGKLRFVQAVERWVELAQVEQRGASAVHVALTWPKSWHLLHLIGSRLSFRTVMTRSSMITSSVRSLLAASGVVHVMRRFATCWPGARLLGSLIHEAERMARGGRE